jgi:hypothetical protein
MGEALVPPLHTWYLILGAKESSIWLVMFSMVIASEKAAWYLLIAGVEAKNHTQIERVK